MAYQDILYSVADGVATITLNRPDKLNAWTRTMNKEVREAVTAAGQDDKVRVVVLTGAGRGFCAGADMTLLSGIQAGTARPGTETADKDAEVPFERRADFRGPYSYFPGVPKPIIGAINGPCAGLGMVVALYCDVRFMAREAYFTTAFAKRGLIAEHGISWMLPRLVGTPAALDMLMSARKVDAEEALRVGLVNRVVSGNELMARVTDYARDLATSVSPRSMRVMKQQVWESHFRTLAEDIAASEHEMRLSFDSADFKEGVAHFVEKRAPRFTGR